MFNLFLKFFLKSKFRDIDSGFKIFKREPLMEILKKKPINSDFLSAEICLKFQYKNFKVKEVMVDYFQRNEVSKALPIYKIPSLIFIFGSDEINSHPKLFFNINTAFFLLLVTLNRTLG